MNSFGAAGELETACVCRARHTLPLPLRDGRQDDGRAQGHETFDHLNHTDPGIDAQAHTTPPCEGLVPYGPSASPTRISRTYHTPPRAKRSLAYIPTRQCSQGQRQGQPRATRQPRASCHQPHNEPAAAPGAGPSQHAHQHQHQQHQQHQQSANQRTGHSRRTARLRGLPGARGSSIELGHRAVAGW